MGFNPLAGALSGIRVTDFSHMVAGPYCTLQLAYFGAEVIKIESSKRFDRWRIRDGNKDPEQSRPFSDHNKNKRSITINMKTKQGVELAKKLIMVSDVVVENFSLGVMERFGLDYESLRKLKPSIIMLSMQGMGRTGPRKNAVTWGPNLMPFSGMTYLWNATPEQEPVGSQTSYPDYAAGVHAAVALMAALHFRDMTGQGQLIDISQADTTANLLGLAYMDYLNNGQEPVVTGNRSPYYAPQGYYRCQGDDRWLALSVTTEQQWQRLCAVSGHPEWLEDPRFAKFPDRLANHDVLDDLITSWTQNEQVETLVQKLQEHEIPAAVVASNKDLASDTHMQSRNFLQPIHHPRLGEIVFPTCPTRLERTPARVERHAPFIGQDNEYVFSEVLGLEKEEIEQLVAAEVII